MKLHGRHIKPCSLLPPISFILHLILNNYIVTGSRGETQQSPMYTPCNFLQLSHLIHYSTYQNSKTDISAIHRTGSDFSSITCTCVCMRVYRSMQYHHVCCIDLCNEMAIKRQNCPLHKPPPCSCAYSLQLILQILWLPLLSSLFTLDSLTLCL